MQLEVIFLKLEPSKYQRSNLELITKFLLLYGKGNIPEIENQSTLNFILYITLFANTCTPSKYSTLQHIFYFTVFYLTLTYKMDCSLHSEKQYTRINA